MSAQDAPLSTMSPSSETTAATPLPTQTEGTVENATAAGISLTAVLVGVIVLTVLAAWFVSRSRRQPPARPRADKPFGNP